MRQSEIDKSIDFLNSTVKKLGLRPGQLLMRSDAFIKGLSNTSGLSHKECIALLSLLLTNDIVDLDKSFIKLTTIGYSVFNDGETVRLKLHLEELLSFGKGIPHETVFYSLWDYIGKEEDNPYYTDGKTFYNTIRHFVEGLPPSYSQYMQLLHEEGLSNSRSVWCKDLFCKIRTDELGTFLIRLSDITNNRVQADANNRDEATESDLDSLESSFPNMMNDNAQITVLPTNKIDLTPDKQRYNSMREPKIFISHNSKDKEYAKAIVNLLVSLGLNEETNIFCTSVPGCGVCFGKDFLEAITQQYENHDLLVLFIHSPRYYQSPVSLCEMGAAWVLKSEHRSFLTKDCDFSDLRGVISSNEIAFKAGKEDTYHNLYEFMESIEKTFNLKPKPQARKEDIKKAFIDAVS